MFWLNFFIGAACMLSVLFTVAMVVWMWRTRPSRTYVPAYRRQAPPRRAAL